MQDEEVELDLRGNGPRESNASVPIFGDTLEGEEIDRKNGGEIGLGIGWTGENDEELLTIDGDPEATVKKKKKKRLKSSEQQDEEGEAVRLEDMSGRRSSVKSTDRLTEEEGSPTLGRRVGACFVFLANISPEKRPTDLAGDRNSLGALPLAERAIGACAPVYRVTLQWKHITLLLLCLPYRRTLRYRIALPHQVSTPPRPLPSPSSTPTPTNPNHHHHYPSTDLCLLCRLPRARRRRKYLTGSS